MESNTQLITILIVFLLGLGINYALQILHSPTESGWTWSQVVTGVGMIILGVLLILSVLGIPIEIITIVLIGVTVLLGGPMAVLQAYKKWLADQKVNDIHEKKDFTIK